MKNTNLFKMFSENRLVWQQPKGQPKEKWEQERDAIDAGLSGSPSASANPVDAAKQKARDEMDKRQEQADEQARASSVERCTNEIFDLINGFEKKRAPLVALASKIKNPDLLPVALKNARDRLLRTAKNIGAKGDIGGKVTSGSDLSAMASQVMANLCENEFGIDVEKGFAETDIKSVLDTASHKRVDRYAYPSKDGAIDASAAPVVVGTRVAFEAPSQIRNKFASLYGAIGMMEMELSDEAYFQEPEKKK